MKSYRFPLGVAALLGLAGLIFEAGGQSSAPAGATAAVEKPAPASPGDSLALGKKIFVERCAKCHGENGSKPLASGPPLSERNLTDEQLAKSVRGRLKAFSEEEQRAVAAYIRSFQKKN